MSKLITLPRIVVVGVALVAVLLAVGWMTREDPAAKPYLKVLGRGFLFNYRVADVTYGFTAIVIRPLPVGSVIEADFEDPQGGPPVTVRQRVGTDTVRYGFQSPPVRGVEAGKPYRVTLRVFDREEKERLWTDTFTVTSQISDTVVPDEPLTIGPGYALNPDS
ncbi:MAG: hypothetical protein R3D45_12075 [Rhizobiaceae bacterium]